MNLLLKRIKSQALPAPWVVTAALVVNAFCKIQMMMMFSRYQSRKHLSVYYFQFDEPNICGFGIPASEPCARLRSPPRRSRVPPV